MGSRNHKKTSILDYRDQGFKIKNTTDKISDLRKYYNYFMDQVRNYHLSNFVENHIAYFKSVQMETEIKCVIWSEAPSRSLAYPIHNGTLKALFYQNEYLIHVFSLCKLIIFIRGVFKPVWISLLWMKEQIELLQKPKTMREIVRI